MRRALAWLTRDVPTPAWLLLLYVLALATVAVALLAGVVVKRA